MAIEGITLNGSAVEYDTDEFSVVSDDKGVHYLHYIGDGSESVLNPKGNTSCYKMFSNYDGSKLDLSNFDTSKVTNMSGMFQGCEGLEELDLSNFDTSEVTDMSKMFYNSLLEEVDVSSFDTSKVTDMSEMFSSCPELRGPDISNFDTSKVTNMSGMFSGRPYLIKIDLSNFDTSEVTDMSEMFAGAYLSELDLSNFDTSKVVNMCGMFSGCDNLEDINLSNFDTSRVTNMAYMFGGGIFTELNLSSFDTSRVTDMEGMFGTCYLLEDLDLFNFDTSKVTNMSRMFYDCEKLSEVGLSNFDTSKVTNMSGMFSECKNLEELNLSHFDTSEVTNMSEMFHGCEELTELDLSSFNTGKVTHMQRMFCGCKKLKELDISSFDTSKVTNMSNLFSYCSSLRQLDLSHFDINEETDTTGMFDDCKELNLDRVFEGKTENPKVDDSKGFNMDPISYLNSGSAVEPLNKDLEWQLMKYSRINVSVFPALEHKAYEFSLKGNDIILKWLSQGPWKPEDMNLFKSELRRFFYYSIDDLPSNVTTVKVIVRDREQTQEEKFKFNLDNATSVKLKLPVKLGEMNSVDSLSNIADAIKKYLYSKPSSISDRILGSKDLGIADTNGVLFNVIDIGKTFHVATDLVYKYYWKTGTGEDGCLNFVTPMDKIDLIEVLPNDFEAATGKSKYTWEQHRFDDPCKNIFTEKLLNLFGKSGNYLSGLYSLVMHKNAPAFYNALYEGDDTVYEYPVPYYITDYASEAVAEIIKHFGTKVKAVYFAAQSDWSFEKSFCQGYYSATCEDGEELIVVY